MTINNIKKGRFYIMKKVFNFGKIDFQHTGKKCNLVTVEMEYKEDGDKKRFSVCANVWDARHHDIVAGGQCLDRIVPYMKNNPVFMEILRLWKLYHLNDMHPECEHQAAAGWNQKAAEKVTLYHWQLTREAMNEQKAAEKAAISALKAGKTFTPSERQTFFACLPYSLTTYTENIPKYYEPKKSLYTGDGGHTETKSLGWLREDEHPEGILAKPCPVCGYKYGSSWMYFPIPKEDEEIIYSLLKG